MMEQLENLGGFAFWIILFLAMLHLIVVGFFGHFPWARTAPKSLLPIFSIPRLILVAGWAIFFYIVASALFNFPVIDLFPPEQHQ